MPWQKSVVVQLPPRADITGTALNPWQWRTAVVPWVRATKFLQYLPRRGQAYVDRSARLGMPLTTGDAEGDVLNSQAGQRFDPGAVESFLPHVFTGDYRTDPADVLRRSSTKRSLYKTGPRPVKQWSASRDLLLSTS